MKSSLSLQDMGLISSWSSNENYWLITSENVRILFILPQMALSLVSQFFLISPKYRCWKREDQISQRYTELQTKKSLLQVLNSASGECMKPWKLGVLVSVLYLRRNKKTKSTLIKESIDWGVAYSFRGLVHNQ